MTRGCSSATNLLDWLDSLDGVPVEPAEMAQAH